MFLHPMPAVIALKRDQIWWIIGEKKEVGKRTLLHTIQRRSYVVIYTNKIGDCLFIYLFVYLSICSAIGGQTARPKRLKFGG